MPAISARPSMEHRKRMLARPAVQKAVAAEGTQIS
jgi:hypothetical protein